MPGSRVSKAGLKTGSKAGSQTGAKGPESAQAKGSPTVMILIGVAVVVVLAAAGLVFTLTRSRDSVIDYGPLSESQFKEVDKSKAKRSATRIVVKDCYNKRLEGDDYNGQITVTKSGRDCATWPERWETILYGFQLSGNPNGCFNPGGYQDQAWCFVVDKSGGGGGGGGGGGHESCDIPACFADESFSDCRGNPCLNGASCFNNCETSKPFVRYWANTVVCKQGILYNCRCADGFVGKDCESYLVYTGVQAKSKTKFVDCYDETNNGKYYLGDVKISESGKPCERWDVQVLSEHEKAGFRNLKYSNVRDVGNYCRNPYVSTAPEYLRYSFIYCYTKQKGIVSMEACKIARCNPITNQWKDSFKINGYECVKSPKRMCQRYQSLDPVSPFGRFTLGNLLAQCAAACNINTGCKYFRWQRIWTGMSCHLYTKNCTLFVDKGAQVHAACRKEI